MDERQKRLVLESEVNLTPEEIAILYFTNDNDNSTDRDPKFASRVFRNSTAYQVLTSKESYYWAVAVAIAIKEHQHIDEFELINSYQQALRAHIDRIKSIYHTRKLQDPRLATSNSLFIDIFQDFNTRLTGNADLELIINKTSEAFESLLNKNLIEDPIEITTATMIIGAIGLIPFGFTAKTRQGKVVFRRINAFYWSYEKRRERGIETTSFNFKLIKLIKAFKQALIQITQEETDLPD